MTINLPMESMKRLEILGMATKQSQTYLAAMAIEQYLDLQDWQTQAIKDAVVEADSPGAVFLDHDDVMERIKLKKRSHR